MFVCSLSWFYLLIIYLFYFIYFKNIANSSKKLIGTLEGSLPVFDDLIERLKIKRNRRIYWFSPISWSTIFHTIVSWSSIRTSIFLYFCFNFIEKKWYNSSKFFLMFLSIFSKEIIIQFILRLLPEVHPECLFDIHRQIIVFNHMILWGFQVFDVRAYFSFFPAICYIISFFQM